MAVGSLVAYLARPSAQSSPSPPPQPAPPAVPTALAPVPPSPRPRAPGRARSQDETVTETRIGSITLVDVRSGISALGPELNRQAREAQKGRQKLVVWLVVPDCEPCSGVAASLPDPRMQQALQDVRLVRLNVRDFYVELKHLNVPVEKIPGFALLGKDNLPIDYVHGGEWDEDIARNIAPVLGKFVRGDYANRRDPWRGGKRDDETPI